MEKVFLLRNDKGKVYNKVVRPAVLFDTEFNAVFKIGEFEDMITELIKLTSGYRNIGLINKADRLAVMDLPHDQNEIDKLTNFTDYVGTLYSKVSNK